MPGDYQAVCLVPAVVNDGPPCLARLRYAADDPWAVILDVDGHTLHIDRQTLLDGLDGSAGHTDGVTAWPAQRGDDRVLVVAVPAGGGTVTVTLARGGIDAFLSAAELMVPRGAEAAAIDLDSELGRLLGH